MISSLSVLLINMLDSILLYLLLIYCDLFIAYCLFNIAYRNIVYYDLFIALISTLYPYLVAVKII